MNSLNYNKFRPLFFFYKNSKITSYLSILLTIAIVNLTIGCSYYKIKKVTVNQTKVTEQIEKFNEQNKYIIIHSGDEIWNLVNIIIDKNNKSLFGTVAPISLERTKELTQQRKTPRKKTFRYKKSKPYPLNEVHIYLYENEDIMLIKELNKQITIPFTHIKSISINDMNKERSILMVFIGVVIPIIMIIIAIDSLNNMSVDITNINN